MLFDNRTETQNISNTDFIILNTGSTRNRGLEGELYYDFLAPFQHPPIARGATRARQSGRRRQIPTCARRLDRRIIIRYKLIAFSNVQFLDAKFTESALLQPGTDRTLVGNTPAFAPDFLLKGGISFQKRSLFQHSFDGCLRLTAILAGHQYWERGRSRKRTFLPTGFQSFGRFYLTKNLRLIGGISNLTDAKLLRSRICQRNRARATPIRLRWSVAEFLTSAGTGVK